MGKAKTTTKPAPAARTAPRQPSEPPRYFNRELSWLKFNERVLGEALDERTPLLERVRFLSIFGSNLDEFFMIRVSGLKRQLEGGAREAPPDGMTPAEQIAAIREQLLPPLRASHECWRARLLPQLRTAGIRVLRYEELKRKQRKLLRQYFEHEIFPVLTPLAFDPGHPFPHISNLSLNLAVAVRTRSEGERFARLKVPPSFPRLLRIPDEERAEKIERLGLEDIAAPNFVWLEEVIAANLDRLFEGVEVVCAYPFRVTRDADIEIEEDEAGDLLIAMSEIVGQRQFGTAVRLEIDAEMPERIQEILIQNLRLAPYQVYRMPSPIGIADVAQLASLDRAELKYPPYTPIVPPILAGDESTFSVLRRRNVVLFHPFDSFNPVVSFIRDAADDPDVLAIKQTLYRVGPNSPVVEALLRARENDKQVSVLVELKARFDEANNIGWARALERAGVHVVYGVMGLKTHAKMSLVVRRERDGIRRYVHLATGNYNPITARVYTDLGYFTADPEIAEDVSDLFNALTGVSQRDSYRKLLVAPTQMRRMLLARIAREVDQQKATGDGYLAFKLNALTDRECIRALYEASCAGVRVDLQIRGICCLKPGVPGMSEHITVTSIVGRFLEHARLFYFRNGGRDELLAGSADLMPRNLDHRFEVLFPIEDPKLLAAVRDEILMLELRDNQKSHRLKPDGAYERVAPKAGQPPVDSQAHFLAHGGRWRHQA
ncbi:MAG: polyphosphate kinase 1 [Myxococcales bacterium]|nr:polyphosphate kinase 1 [Myxococcales bacterium]